MTCQEFSKSSSSQKKKKGKVSILDVTFSIESFQLRGAQILDAVRLHKNGFPESLSFGEFWRRYRILSEDNQSKNPSHQEMKSSVEDLLTEMDLDKSAFRLGNSQVRKMLENYASGARSSFTTTYLKNLSFIHEFNLATHSFSKRSF